MFGISAPSNAVLCRLSYSFVKTTIKPYDHHIQAIGDGLGAIWINDHHVQPADDDLGEIWINDLRLRSVRI